MNRATEIGQLYGFVFTAILAILVLFLAKKKGFFRLPPNAGPYPLSLSQVLIGFGSYLGLGLVILPGLIITVGYLLYGSWEGATAWIKEWRGWLQLFSLLIIFSWFVFYVWLARAKTYPLFWNGDSTPSWRSALRAMGMGVLGWVIIYPLEIVLSLLAAFLAKRYLGSTNVEQDAVVQLKNALSDPWLFVLMFLVVSIAVPFVEEFLFRGLLQTWLKRFLGRFGGVVLSSFIFSVVHFTRRQGVSNFELLIPLFALSCMIGFVYERERKLWAPIALHGIFNGFSALFIALSHN